MLTLWTHETPLPSLLAEAHRLAWNDDHLRPAADVVESEAGYEVTLDLPGVDPKAIQLQVEGDVLTVEAERRPAAAPKDGAVHRAERPNGRFARSFSLPGSVDGARVEARYEAGVLTVTLPKREEARPRTIQVKAA